MRLHHPKTDPCRAGAGGARRASCPSSAGPRLQLTPAQCPLVKPPSPAPDVTDVKVQRCWGATRVSEKSGGDRVTTRFSEKKELSAASVTGGGRGLGLCVWGGWDLRRGRGRAAGSGPGVCRERHPAADGGAGSRGRGHDPRMRLEGSSSSSPDGASARPSSHGWASLGRPGGAGAPATGPGPAQPGGGG